MKKIGIITINYNNAAGIKRTLESIAAQSFRDIALVVIDGGSADESAAIIKQFEHLISYRVSEKDNGIYDAQNKGIVNCDAEYLLFLNSGDTLADENVLQDVLPHLNSKHQIVYGNMLIDDSNVQRLGQMPATIDLRQMMLDTLWHPVSFISKSLFNSFGLYDTNYKLVADYEFFFRVLIVKQASQKYINRTISIFATDGASSDQKNIAQIKAEKEAVWAKYLTAKEISSFLQQEDERYKEQQKQSRWFRRWFRNWFQS